MNKTIVLITLLTCNAIIYSMQIVPVNYIDQIPEKNLTESIIPRLNRTDRQALRNTSTKYRTIIPCQDELNKKYMAAYARKDTKTTIFYRNMGGISYYEELFNAFYNNNVPLAKWLIDTNRIPLYSALQDSISHNDAIICKLLLNTYKPSTLDTKLYSCQTQAISLRNQNLITLFTKYYNENDTGLIENS